MRTLRLPGRHDLAALAARHPQRYPCLLESVAHGTPHSRWDLLLAFPCQTLCLDASGRLSRDGTALQQDDFLAALDTCWQAERCAPIQDELPFHGGWAVFLAYELAASIEPCLQLPACAEPLPVAQALRCPAAALYDHQQQCTWLLAESGHEACLEWMQADLDAAWTWPSLPAVLECNEDPPQAFLDAVARTHEHLRAGDTFQANLSRAWQARFAAAPLPAVLYHALREANPAPFAALWQQAGWAIASSSPERLLEVRDGVVQTRPIAGTRPRHAGEDDAARCRELAGHPKERAEHIMLVDLERNDLGRICRPGSVEVDELLAVESYAHVHHLVSNVRGQLHPEVTPGQVLAAMFPGGTITGCPKLRCMQIIAGLEGTGRGAYTGSIGYLDRSGDMDFNILIRSLSVHGNTLGFRAGAGIVVDSVAEQELAETRAKARGLLQALEPRHAPARAHQRQA